MSKRDKRSLERDLSNRLLLVRHMGGMKTAMLSRWFAIRCIKLMKWDRRIGFVDPMHSKSYKRLRRLWRRQDIRDAMRRRRIRKAEAP